MVQMSVLDTLLLRVMKREQCVWLFWCFVCAAPLTITETYLIQYKDKTQCNESVMRLEYIQNFIVYYSMMISVANI